MSDGPRTEGATDPASEKRVTEHAPDERATHAPKEQATEGARESYFSPWRTVGQIASELTDEPSGGFAAWARTTAGVVAFLLALQLTTGLLLAFYYVPSAESAHTTVAFVEKVVPAGSWVRALHFYGSSWLPAALALHLAQMLWRGAYRRRPVGWLAALVLLALVLLNGATGYSLPWDARGFYGTRVAASLAGGLPLMGHSARRWLLGGEELSTLTLSRFYALHALAVPALMLLAATARLFVFRERAAEGETPTPVSEAIWLRSQLARNALTVGVVFVALALLAWKFPAPLGPPAGQAEAGYLPRPGVQFLWLFQMLKYLPPSAASLAALLVPALLLGALALLPFLRLKRLEGKARHTGRKLGAAIFVAGLLLWGGLTALAYFEDARDARVGEQLARQRRQEEEFRRAPFVPRQTSENHEGATSASGNSQTLPDGDAAPVVAPPPEAYARNCAKCHGAGGEGRSIYPPLTGVSARPRRTFEDIVGILNDPAAYGLERRMPNFRRKLSEEEKRAIAAWVVSLK